VLRRQARHTGAMRVVYAQLVRGSASLIFPLAGHSPRGPALRSSSLDSCYCGAVNVFVHFMLHCVLHQNDKIIERVILQVCNAF